MSETTSSLDSMKAMTPESDDNSSADQSNQLSQSNGLIRETLKSTTQDIGEDEEVLASKVRRTGRASVYSSGSLLEMERTSGSLMDRSRQAMLHVALSDARLLQLEDKIGELMQIAYNTPDQFKTRKKKQPVYQHILRRCNIDDFRLSMAAVTGPIHLRPALEVLVPDQIIAVPGQNDSDTSTTFASTRRASQPHLARSPQRLRMMPQPLISHLDRISGRQFSLPTDATSREVLDGRIAYSGLVFLRPFKFFVQYHEEIRRSAKTLEESLEIKSPESNEPLLRESGSRFIHGEEKDFDNRDLLMDLNRLIEFIDVDLKPTFDLRRNIQDGTVKDIEYEDLWHLFELGDYVMSQSHQDHAYRVVNYTGGREPLTDRIGTDDEIHPVDGLTVDCYSLMFDGSSYVPKLETFCIRRYLGRLPIASLPIFPLRFHPDKDKIQASLLAQGQNYLQLTRQPFSHLSMYGRTLDEPSHDVDSPVMVDMALAITTVPEWRPKSRLSEADLTKSDDRETYIRPYCLHRYQGCCGSDIAFKDLLMDKARLSVYLGENLRILAPRKEEDLLKEELMLLPHWVYAFVLRNRQWVKLRIADLSPVQFENDFDELMLPDNHKRTVLALVRNHEKARMNAATRSSSVAAALDLVRGKGTGLIILLHGEPGVGKTSTAECVADSTKRPLFPITCGDIGETAMDVEKNLHHNFRLAHKWGCVLLLDEADVFLAKRNKTDLRRNAVTSVFLRSLEYYAGILFLTTNRVGGIDPAFKSRIHVSLYYPRLDLPTTRKLYEVFIARARAQQDKTGTVLFKIKEKEILRFAERHFRQLEKKGFGTWNGRQIRNAFQIAIALAEEEGQQTEPGEAKPALGKAQFQLVADGAKEFEEYMVSTLGAPESDIAIREEWRADRFTSVEPAEATIVSSRMPYKPTRAKDPESETETDPSSEDDTESEDDRKEERLYTLAELDELLKRKGTQSRRKSTR